jgi:hypothetical protein
MRLKKGDRLKAISNEWKSGASAPRLDNLGLGLQSLLFARVTKLKF